MVGVGGAAGCSPMARLRLLPPLLLDARRRCWRAWCRGPAVWAAAPAGLQRASARGAGRSQAGMALRTQDKVRLDGRPALRAPLGRVGATGVYTRPSPAAECHHARHDAEGQQRQQQQPAPAKAHHGRQRPRGQERRTNQVDSRGDQHEGGEVGQALGKRAGSRSWEDRGTRRGRWGRVPDRAASRARGAVGVTHRPAPRSSPGRASAPSCRASCPAWTGRSGRPSCRTCRRHHPSCRPCSASCPSWTRTAP